MGWLKKKLNENVFSWFPKFFATGVVGLFTLLKLIVCKSVQTAMRLLMVLSLVWQGVYYIGLEALAWVFKHMLGDAVRDPTIITYLLIAFLIADEARKLHACVTLLDFKACTAFLEPAFTVTNGEKLFGVHDF